MDDEGREVLVTGAPSFTAMQLVWRILEREPRTRVTLLVRGDRLTRTENLLSRYPAARERVRMWRALVTEVDFGLEPARIAELRERVTDVYHMAGLYHLGVAKEQAEEVNIRGTRMVLDAARTMTRLQRFNHLSSAYVCGDREGVILEDDLELGQHFRNTYERTRFTAELDVRRARREMPVSVFRPSLVVGDSRTGEIGWFDGPWLFVQAIARNPDRLPTLLPSASQYPFNVVPSDWVAAALHEISRRDDAVGRTFHLTDPAPVSQASAFRLLAQHIHEGPVRSTLQSKLAERILSIGMVERMTRRQRPFLNELDSLAIFNCSNTLKALHGTGLPCPFFPDYVARLVEFAHLESPAWLPGKAAAQDDLAGLDAFNDLP